MGKEYPSREFFVATPEEIRAGRTSDVYFHRTLEILRKAGRDREPVVAEVSTGGLPNGWPWGVFCGLEEVVRPVARRGHQEQDAVLHSSQGISLLLDSLDETPLEFHILSNAGVRP